MACLNQNRHCKVPLQFLNYSLIEIVFTTWNNFVNKVIENTLDFRVLLIRLIVLESEQHFGFYYLYSVFNQSVNIFNCLYNNLTNLSSSLSVSQQSHIAFLMVSTTLVLNELKLYKQNKDNSILFLRHKNLLLSLCKTSSILVSETVVQCAACMESGQLLYKFVVLIRSGSELFY